MKFKFDKVVLIGMRGSGKSHFASCLSKELGWKKIDTDDEIVRKTGTEIAIIVKNEGWDAFRDIEHDVCKEVSAKKNVIVSTGGGAITFERNKIFLKENALVVFLFVEFNQLVLRLQKRASLQKRPSLTEKKNISEEIKHVWEERADIYFDSADVVFRAKDTLSSNVRINVEKNAKILAQKIKSML